MKQLGLKHYMLDKAMNSSLWVCQCGWEICKSTHSFGPATRDHFLIHYVVAGKGTYKNSSGEYHLSEGQGFLISPGETTLYNADKETPWEYYWVGFKGIDAKHILELCSLSEKTPIFECKETEEVTELFANMFNAYSQSHSREYSMLGYLYLILAFLMSQTKPPKFTSSNVKVYLNSAVEYINNNYSYDINVAKLASHIGIDRTYLYRIFVDNLNISPEQYLLKVRMPQIYLKRLTIQYCKLHYQQDIKTYPIFRVFSSGFLASAHLFTENKCQYEKIDNKYKQ